MVSWNIGQHRPPARNACPGWLKAGMLVVLALSAALLMGSPGCRLGV